VGSAVPVGTDSIGLPTNTAKGFYTHALVYTKSSFAEQTTPAAVPLIDLASTVLSTALVDLDLDPEEVGGTATWIPAGDVVHVMHYVIYMAMNDAGGSRSQIGIPIAVGTNKAELLADTAKASFTHVLVYTKSSLVEQTTPDALPIADTNAPPTSVAFVDLDLDPFELGGRVLWHPPTDASLVQQYEVYFSLFVGANVSNSQLGSSVPSGTNVVGCPENLETGPYTHVLVYSRSTLAEQTTPGAVTIVDNARIVNGTDFDDLDLDQSDVGGVVTWVPPEDPSHVVHYLVYFEGAGKSQVGVAVQVGTNTLTVPVNTAKLAYVYLTIYTKSTMFEQTTPAVEVLEDTVSSVSGALFPDRDLDASEVGGAVEWTAPSHSSHVTVYAVYFGNSTDGDVRSLLGSFVVLGTNVINLVGNTPLETHTHVLIYSRSSLAEQTTPVSVPIVDTASSVSSLAFPDQDFDASELGGTLSWDPPLDVSQVTHYRVYLALSALGADRSQLGTDVSIGTNWLSTPGDVALGSHLYLLVYTQSAMPFAGEQTTPSALLIEDIQFSVSNLTFVDKDLDAGEIGGVVMWEVPVNASFLARYIVYLATSSDGTGRIQIDGELEAGTNQVSIPTDTALGSFGFVVVYTSSSLAEQTSPSFLLISDVAASVSDVAFTDLDLDSLELGGSITWDHPDDLSQLVGYNVYLATDANGGQRSLVSDSILNDINETGLAAGTRIGQYTHIAVYSTSTLAEQSMPAVLDILDVAVAETGFFVDFDLDPVEIGGAVTWSPPLQEALVTSYAVYLATNSSGDARSLVGGGAPVGTNHIGVPPNTPIGVFTHVVIYAASSLEEQTTPSSVPLLDNEASIDNQTFVDKDLDGGELGGIITWEEPAEAIWVVEYVVFLATLPSGSIRSQINSAVVVGTNKLSVPLDTNLDAFAYVVVYTKSVLAEQTTPTFLAIVDAASTVNAVTFVDEDLDYLQIGGSLTWLPSEVSQVAQYVVHKALSSNGTGREQIGSPVEVGTNRILVLANTALASYTHILVYTESSLAEQTTPAGTEIVDVVSRVSSLAFVDKDLDPNEVGGTVTWAPPSDTSSVVGYLGFFAAAGSGMGKSQVSLLVASGTNSLTVLENTALSVHSYILVYTRSTLEVQTTPDVSILLDINASVSNVAFTDQDLDALHIGGAVTWDPSSDVTEVTHYIVYLGTSLAGLDRSQIGADLVIGTNSVDLVVDTDLGLYTHAVVYTHSSLFEATTPDACTISDASSTVMAVAFVDLDLDTGDLGGIVTWTASDDASQVIGHLAYLATSYQGAGRSTIGGVLSVGTNAVGIEVETDKGAYTHIVVYARSPLAEQTTPGFALITDAAATASTVGLEDLDLDSLEIGGTVTWIPPGDVSRVAAYAIYRAEDSAGGGRSQVSTDVGIGINSATIPVDTAMDSFTHWVVFTRSSLVEQTTPAYAVVADIFSQVLMMPFADGDLDLSELGGVVSWNPPVAISQVTQYWVYLAVGSAGAARSQIGSALGVGTNEAAVSTDTQIKSYTHVVVYTQSSLAEQSTPAAVEISDANSSVSALSFLDRDLDALQIGGVLMWTPPEDVAQVVQYMTYLATDGAGGSRSQVGGAVNVGTDETFVSVDTVYTPNSFVVVYSKSQLAEQTTPVSLAFIDLSAHVLDIEFVDYDIDMSELGGNLTWRGAGDQAVVTGYVVYLAADSLGAARSQIGDDVAYGIEEVSLEPDFLKASYTHALVYTRSSLFERSTPEAVPLTDHAVTMSTLAFTDQDLDGGELGGLVAWIPSGDIALVVSYSVYLARDGAGAGRLQISTSVAVGTNQVTCLADTPHGSFTHVAVYAHSALAEQTTPSSTELIEVAVSVAAVQWTDKDLDQGDVGGLIAWSLPADVSPVVAYAAYLAANSSGDGRSQVAGNALVGTNTISVPADTSLAGFGHVVVYTMSLFAEQSTPVSTTLLDKVAHVSISNESGFVDRDLDATELGGVIVWEAPNEAAYVTVYHAYLAMDPAGMSRSQVAGDVTVGSNILPVPPDVPIGSWRYIVVYTQSSLSEQTTPSSVSISDSEFSVANVIFVDMDLDALEFGGDTTWSPPGDTSLVTHYIVFFARASELHTRSRVGTDIVVGTNVVSIPPETALDTYERVVVYTKSSLAEQSTPVVISATDHVAIVPNFGLVDEDLDELEIGGAFLWQPPVGIVYVSSYLLYLTSNVSVDDRTHIGSEVPVGTNAVSLSADIPVAAYEHLSIYTKSSLCEQTTPTVVPFSDAIATVVGLSFVDRDLDQSEFGGFVTWSEPVQDISLVDYYIAYTATDSQGAGKVQLGVASLRGTNLVTVPANMVHGSYTHLVVYTRSSLAEQTTPAALPLIDTSSSVSAVLFEDQDLDSLEIAGTVRWNAPMDISQVVSYVVYLSTDSSGSDRSQLGGALLKGTNEASVPVDTALDSNTNFVVYTMSDLVEQTTPGAATIADRGSLVRAVSFEDQDLDPAEIGGKIVWTPPADTSMVTHYLVYFATSDAGAARSQYSQAVMVGTNEIAVDENTTFSGYSHIVVFTKSSLAEQTTPAHQALVDASCSVSELSFPDKDLDTGEVAGSVTWRPAGDTLVVAYYAVYLSFDGSGGGRSQLGSDVSSGTNALDVPDNTQVSSYTHIVVYAASLFTEQTTPSTMMLVDSSSTVQQLEFVDKDLDAFELGGLVTWSPAADVSEVAVYAACFSVVSTGSTARTQIGGFVDRGTNFVNVPSDTLQGLYPYLVVFAKSSLYEQSTPATMDIVDVAAVVDAFDFVDQDLDLMELGGTLTWQPPGDISQVTGYIAFLSIGAGVFNRSQLGGVVGVGSNQLGISPDTHVGAYTHIAIYSRSSLFEQSTPDILAITDESSSVEWLAFIDRDLDALELGGIVTWSQPVSSSQVTHYVVYLSMSAWGANSSNSQIGHVLAYGTNRIDLALDTKHGAHTHMVVYTLSALAEQTSPTSLLLSDTIASVAEVSFEDQDLDRHEIGGTLAWTLSGDVAQVTHYSVYLGIDSAGASRSQLDGSVAFGTNSIDIAANTPVGLNTHFVIYTKSALDEQTTPTAAILEDEVASVVLSTLSFADQDLDADELGGPVAWIAPFDMSRVSQYRIYLDTSAAGANKSMIGFAVLAGTNQIDIPEGTAIASYTYISVYTVSLLLLEQTTPASVAMYDSVESVEDVTFIDNDLDNGHLGGRVSWSPPANLSLTSHYVVYLASSGSGADKSVLGDMLAVGTNEAYITVDTEGSSFTHVVVFTKSLLFEQTTPASALVIDVFVSVSAASFADGDLDAGELGGMLSWDPPADTSRVLHFLVYLSPGSAGATPGKSLLGELNASSPTEIVVPGDTAHGPYTHLLIFTRSALAQQTTPVTVEISDTAASASGLSFVDDDLDRDEVGGTIAWSVVGDALHVAGYMVYLAVGSSAGVDRSQVGSALGIGTNELYLPANTQKGLFTYVLVFARSTFSEQTTPVAAVISDTSGNVPSLAFADLDLDAGVVGGTITWGIPVDTSRLVFYRVYFADDTVGSNRSALGSGLALGTNELSISVGTAFGNFSYILVFLSSQLAEQTTAAAVTPIMDVAISASLIRFDDLDLDIFELGGTITWTLPSITAPVGHMSAYFARDAGGSDRSQIGDLLPSDATAATVATGTALSFFSHVVVYAWSPLGEQKVPASSFINDAVAIASGVSFVDADLDIGQIGGRVEWSAPVDETRVEHYVVYLALTASAVGRSLVGYIASNTSYFMDLPAGTEIGAYTRVLVYTKSSLVEQTTPATAFFNDSSCLVSSLSFVDQDLDYGELGGTITWDPPADVSEVGAYVAYLATNPAGMIRSALGGEGTVGTNAIEVTSETVKGAYTHITLFVRSALYEQTVPTAAPAIDVVVSVSGVVFVDGDLDALEVGGTIEWMPPLVASETKSYIVYLAFVGPLGLNRSQVGSDILLGTNHILLPVNSPKEPYTDVMVYTKSSLFEQTTPSGTALGDNMASVSAIAFADQDLDAAELGGAVTWTAPVFASEVTHYLVYLAGDAHSPSRSLVGNPVVSGTNAIDISVDTAEDNHTHVLVYTKSLLAEQTTPGALGISGVASSVVNVSFIDEDLDGSQIGGTVTWEMPPEITQVTHYIMYLVTSVSGVSRSQVGSPMTSGTTAAVLGTDTALQGFTHIAVYTKSSLAEQTTPIAISVTDVLCNFSWVRLEDRDLDAGQLGGVVAWSVLEDTPPVTHYAVYFAPTPDGAELSQLGVLVAVGTNQAAVPVDTLRGSHAYVLVLARSSMSEQTTPTVVGAVSDAVASVSNMDFVDYDLDSLELGGNLSWRPQPVASGGALVVSYVIYFAQDSGGALRSQLGAEVPGGTGEVSLAENTPLGGYSHLVVYCKSSLAEQTVPTGLALSDTAVALPWLLLSDLDLDSGELGGSVMWGSPSEVLLVERYGVYLSTSSIGGGRSQLGDFADVSTNVVFFDVDLPAGPYTHVTVFAESKLAAQTSPAASIAVSDTVASVSDVVFLDRDLDAGEVGGAVTWAPPIKTTWVTQYVVHFASGGGAAVDANRSQVGDAVVVGANALNVNADVFQGSYARVLVYTKSALAEQTTPASGVLDDVACNTSGEFVDEDLDVSRIGGDVTWDTPLDMSAVTHYIFYLSTDPMGADRSQINGALPLGTNLLSIFAGTPIGASTHIVIYMQSSLAEQTTPAPVSIVDVSVSVTGLNFTDIDLDADQLGGVILWNLREEDLRMVTALVVYLGVSSVGAGRSVVGAIPAVDIDGSLTLPAETPLGSFTHVLAYAKSVLAEQTTPTWAAIVDTVGSVAGIVLQDLDLDTGELGGSMTWTPAVDVPLATHYVVYLAGDSGGALRSKVGEDVAAGTNMLSVPADTAIGFSTHLVVYLRSVLAEQTVPSGAEIDDMAIVIDGFSFDDYDLDPGEVGGVVSWHHPADVSRVTYFNVYLVASDISANRSLVGSTAGGTNSISLPDNIPVGTFTDMAVYARSLLAEQSTPVTLNIIDVHAALAGLSFDDLDLDPLEFGGSVVWIPPAGISEVRNYSVYLASSGAERNKTIGVVGVGTNRVDIPADTAFGTLGHIAVYVSSSLAEQTTPTSASITDTFVALPGLSFADRDTNIGHIGGLVLWQLPPGSALVTSYALYLSHRADGGKRSPLSIGISAEATSVRIPGGTDLAGASFIAMFAASSLAEQSTAAVEYPLHDHIEFVTDCSLGVACQVALCCDGLDSGDRLTLLSSPTCDVASRIVASLAGLLSDSVQPSHDNATYNLGMAVAGVPGNYTLCWSASVLGVGDHGRWIGVLTMTGPELSNLSCTASLTCALRLTGVGLGPVNGVLLVSGGVCGDAAASPLAVAGLVNPQSPQAGTSEAGEHYLLGVGTGVVPTDSTFRLCWSHDPTGAAGSAEAYRVAVDDAFALLGPHATTRPVECTISIACRIALTGIGLSPMNEVLIAMVSAGGCGAAALPVTWPGLTIPQRPSMTDNAIYMLGVPVLPVSDVAYVLCWGHSPAEGTGHPVELGSFLMSGPVVTSARCTLGELCSVQLAGSGHTPESSLLLRLPGEDCSNSSLTAIASLSGLTNPQSPQPSDNATYQLGTSYMGPVGPGFVMCWVASMPDPFDAAQYIATVGDFSLTGPASPTGDAVVCYVGALCTLELLGHGLEPGAGILLLAGSADCVLGGVPTAFPGVSNPVSASVGAPHEFVLGVPALGGGSFDENHTVCWGARPDGPRAVLAAGPLFFRGPYANGTLGCTLGERCLVRITGRGLPSAAAPSSLLIAAGAGACGQATVVSVSWDGILNPANAIPPAGAASPFEDAFIDMGTPIVGQVGSAYSLCWNHRHSADPLDYKTEIDGGFELRGPDLGLVAVCALGRHCIVHLSGVGLSGANAILVTPGGAECGQNFTAPATVFVTRNPVSNPSTPFDAYDLGSELGGPPGLYGLCWGSGASSNLSGSQDAQDFPVALGTLTLGGPTRMDYMCVFGISCVLTLSGIGLSTSDKLAVVSDPSCGASMPSFISFLGLLHDNPVGPEESGSNAGKAYPLGPSPSIARSGTPQASRLCWASAPLIEEGNNVFTIFVGSFTMSGPVQGLSRDCRLCVDCVIEIPGLGLNAADRIIMIESSGVCGNSLQMTSMQLYSSGAGLQNPPSVTVASWDSVIYHVGTPTIGITGDYNICWGRSPSTLGEYSLLVGTFTLYPRDVAAHAGTAWGGCVTLGSMVDYETGDTSDFRTSALDLDHEATLAVDGDNSTGWISDTGPCAEYLNRCMGGACGNVTDWSACPSSPCGLEPAIAFDLHVERLICKLQVTNGVHNGDASYGIRTLIVETASGLGGPWAVHQTFSPLPPACPGSPIPEDLVLAEPASTRFVRLRATESWGASGIGLIEVVFWASPWHSEQQVDGQSSMTFQAPGPPAWAVSGGRAGMAFAAMGGDRAVLLLGGVDQGGQLYNDAHRTSDGGATWEVVTQTAPWSARRGLAAATTASCCTVVLLGGVSRGPSSHEIAQADVWVSLDSGLTWQRQSDQNAWRPRVEHGAAFDSSNRLYLVGGLTCSKRSGPCGTGAGYGELDFLCNDVWQSMDMGQTWMEVVPPLGPPRWPGRRGFNLLADRTNGNALYVVGGRGPHGAALQDVWRSSDGGAVWSPQTLAAPFVGRAFGAALMYPDDTAMLVLGGLDDNGSALNDVWASGDHGQTWSQRASFPGKRHSFGAVIEATGALVVLGGVPFSQAVHTSTCMA